ncbi:MAG: hypothetical protein M1826_006827 [Phylliscum demangeonii]|nr:MAG: hypothetical protein M1826_006827 [Phylliscum demangeonii]
MAAEMTKHMHQLANAINGAAVWLESALGRGDDGRTTLAYHAGLPRWPSTLAYIGHVHLLTTTGCRTLITARHPAPPTMALLARHPLRSLTIPELDELLGRPHSPYPFGKTFDEARDDSSVVFHTSGLTGVPKPIGWTHAFISASAKMHQVRPMHDEPTLFEPLSNARVLIVVPYAQPRPNVADVAPDVFVSAVGV